MRIFKTILVAIVALVLAACSNDMPSLMGNEPFHIEAVEVIGPPPKDGSEEMLMGLRAETLAKASYTPRTDNPRMVRLKITQYHKKSPGISLIVGDSNYMIVVGEVWTIDGATWLTNFEVRVDTDQAINGLIGAAVAAVKKDEKVEQQLNQKAADRVLEKVYGTKAWKVWSKKR